MSERLLDDKKAGSHTGRRAVSHITLRKKKEATKVTKEVERAIKQEPREFMESAQRARSALSSQESKRVSSHSSKNGEQIRALKNELARKEERESFEKEEERIEQKRLDLAREVQVRNLARELKDIRQRKEKAILQSQLEELEQRSNASRQGSKRSQLDSAASGITTSDNQIQRAADITEWVKNGRLEGTRQHAIEEVFPNSNVQAVINTKNPEVKWHDRVPEAWGEHQRAAGLKESMLPKIEMSIFNGDQLRFREWRQMFEIVIEEAVEDPRTRLLYLKQ